MATWRGGGLISYNEGQHPTIGVISREIHYSGTSPIPSGTLHNQPLRIQLRHSCYIFSRLSSDRHKASHPRMITAPSPLAFFSRSMVSHFLVAHILLILSVFQLSACCLSPKGAREAEEKRYLSNVNQWKTTL